MKTLHAATVVASLLLLGCNQSPDSLDFKAPETDAASDPSTTSRTQSSSAEARQIEHDNPKAALASLRTRDQDIIEHIKNVKGGMTEKEVIGVLGEPSRREDDEWYYAISPVSQWIDESIKIKGYLIVFDDGRVKHTKTDGAHYTFRRRDGG
jgi:hypothetical protein